MEPRASSDELCQLLREYLASECERLDDEIARWERRLKEHEERTQTEANQLELLEAEAAEASTEGRDVPGEARDADSVRWSDERVGRLREDVEFWLRCLRETQDEISDIRHDRMKAGARLRQEELASLRVRVESSQIYEALQRQRLSTLMAKSAEVRTLEQRLRDLLDDTK